MQGFVEFMKKWGVIGLAVAVIIGGKLNEWVSALVDDIIMPIVGLAIPGGSWREASITLTENSELLVGHFLGATIDFAIVAFLIYWFFTNVLKDEAATGALEEKQAG